MADFILVLTTIGYAAWIISHITKAFHFSGLTSPAFGTVMIFFLHIHVDNLPMWIIWFFTVSAIWKIVRAIGQAEKPIYMITGLPRKEKSDEQA